MYVGYKLLTFDFILYCGILYSVNFILEDVMKRTMKTQEDCYNEEYLKAVTVQRTRKDLNEEQLLELLAMEAAEKESGKLLPSGDFYPDHVRRRPRFPSLSDLEGSTPYECDERCDL
jgi:hypothetical protein